MLYTTRFKLLTLIAFNGQHFFDDNNMHKNKMMSSTLLSNLHEYGFK